MALIYCSKCNAQISDKAEICPHCGKTSNILHIDKKGNFSEILNKPNVNTISTFPTKKTETFALISFAAGLGGFIILPILFVPIGYIAAIVSSFRLKENKDLKGGGYRIIGAILTTINIFWLMYQYKIGFFKN